MGIIENNGKLYETNFKQLGLEVEFVKGYGSPLGDTLLYNLKYISNYNKSYISSLIEKIAVFHHASLSFVESKEAHFGIFDNTDTQQKVSLSQLLCQNREITIGLDSMGQPVKLDFEKIPHLLIAGTTGSGKSILIHNLICNLMVWYGRNHTKTPQFAIIDPKGNELDKYKNVRNTIFIDDTKMAIRTLQGYCQEMDRRYKENDMNAHDIYIIIDELADLMLVSKFEVEEYIVRIAQKGRACGMHLIVATQNPLVAVVSGLIKANLPYRIVLKTASVRESITALDRKGAEELSIGEAIFKQGVNFVRTKIAFPESELIDKVITINHS